MTSDSRLGRLLDPASLAFIGGEAAGIAIDQCRRMGYDGEIWAVHPTRTELRGIPTVPTVADLPGVPDAAFVGVNRVAAVAAVRELAAVGAGVAVCHASGFAEVGDEGAAMQAELVAAAGSMPVIGPNCYGTVSGLTGAVLWPDQQGLHRCNSGVAFVTQSGNISVNLTMQARGLDVAHVLTLGNQADVTIEEAIENLVADDRVTGIGLHIEALSDVPRFVAATMMAAQRGVPVVALKTGSSTQGAAIAASHTSSMVGRDAAYDALFARCGVRRVSSVPELLDTLHVTSTLGRLAGNRVVSLSCSGGEASLVADRAEHRALDFAPFGLAHRERVAATLNEFVAVTNPFDYHTFIWGDGERLAACFSEVLSGPFDAAMLVLDFPREGLDWGSWWPTLEAFAAASEVSGTPGVVVASMAEGLPATARARALELGLAAVADIDSALLALEAASRPAPKDVALLQANATTDVALASSSATSPTVDEAAGKALLRAAGVDVPGGAACVATVDSAVAVAEEIGYPVTAKILGVDHKSDIDGVRLGLADAAELALAVEHLATLGNEILIEEHIGANRLELLVNVRAEAPIGYLLTVGAGGTMTEILDDTESVLLPCSAAQLDDTLASLRIGPLFAGHRGAAPIATEPVARLVDHLAALVANDATITEIELNPVLLTGNRAIAVDAIIKRETP